MEKHSTVLLGITIAVYLFTFLLMFLAVDKRGNYDVPGRFNLVKLFGAFITLLLNKQARVTGDFFVLALNLGTLLLTILLVLN
jgi:lipid-A-disaccharide synthase-like uncharacterized protein